jgi:predicted dehydrogenase
MTRLKTGLIGCGKFANKHLANLVTMPERFELAAFCDVAEENARQYNEKYAGGHAQVFTDFHEMFRRLPHLDLALICLPPFAHSDEVQVAADHGTHILIEKPIALSSEQAWQMVAAVETAGIHSQVGFMFRFGLAVEKLKLMIANGEAGQVGLMSTRYFCNSLHAPWWRMRDKSGGQITEQVIHMVDLMRYLMGDPARVFSVQNNLFHQAVENYTIEDTSGTVMEFNNGGIGVIFASNNAIPGKWINDYHVIASKVSAEFSDANNASFVFTSEPDLRKEVIASQDNYYLKELLNLYDAIVCDQPTRTPIREGALSLDLALAISKSAELKSLVTIA